MATRVSSESTKDLHPSLDGKDGNTRPPPPKSPHQKDSISSNTGSSQGVLGKIFSPVCYFFSVVMDGYFFCLSVIRWPFEKIGILTPKKSESPPLPQKNLEEQKGDLLEEFSKGSHSQRLQLLVYRIAVWPGDDPEELFIELFNQQDEKVIKGINKAVFHDFDWGVEMKTELPKHLFQALHARVRTSEQEKWVENFREFLFGFPDYALQYAARCFEPESPAYRRFEALKILAKHEGAIEDYHDDKIEDQDVDDLIQKALSDHYKSLSYEEKRKLIGFVETEAFRKIEKNFALELGKMGDNPKIIEIFRPVNGYDSAPDFSKFVNYVHANSPYEWKQIKEKLFVTFPEISKQYILQQIEMFLDLDARQQVDACWKAYETDPSIFKGRLLTLLQSEQEYELTRANHHLIHGNPPAAVRLFYLYQNRFLRDQVSLYNKVEGEAEKAFIDEWEACFDFKTGTVTNIYEFVGKMEDILKEAAYRRAVGDLLNEAFGI